MLNLASGIFIVAGCMNFRFYKCKMKTLLFTECAIRKQEVRDAVQILLITVQGSTTTKWDFFSKAQNFKTS